MPLGWRQIAILLLLAGSALSVPSAIGKKKEKHGTDEPQMSERRRAVHTLNRLTFGPRPGDVQRVAAIGVDRWIDQQLHPEKIDDRALETRLAPFQTLRMNTREIVENFPPPQVIQAIVDGKGSLPSDPTKRAVYEAQLERREEKQERKQAAAGGEVANANSAHLTDEQRMRGYEDLKASDTQVASLLEMSPDQRFKAVLGMSPDRERLLLTSLKGNREKFLDGFTPPQRETIVALNNPQQVVDEELVEGKVLHATYGERQLQEVLTDFWFNHFNVFIGKGADHYLLTSYERDVIRRHAMGKFEELLVATAQSPAMLFYLDNWLSVGPNSDVANGIPKRAHDDWKRRAKSNGPVRQSKGKRSGLNENYGRELMELHTLGVNGGYTQNDVTEVARVFTGWTLKQPWQGGGFEFDERMHEPGDKIVLGHRIKSKGEKEGREVLHLLARHLSTARFICSKLAMRFVSDNPPPALVDRMGQTFLKKDGDIREVLRTMFESPEFWREDTYRAKVKTPMEFAVSALRASGSDVSDALPIARQIQNMGMPLYGMQPPTGYSMKAETWVNSSALLGRMNFALALSSGKLKGAQVNPEQLLEEGQTTSPVGAFDPQQVLAVLEDSLLAGDVSQQTHETIAARLSDPLVTQRKLDDPARSANIGIIEGLLLGSPEFQKR